jgi:hypothetical protein
MTVEFAPARLPWQSASRNCLGGPDAFMALRVPIMLLTCVAAACTLGACGERDGDARVALTTSAARELAQAQPGNARSPALANAFTLASDAASSNPPDPANSGAMSPALSALAVRSPAKPPAGESAQGAQDEPLVTPVIHSAD